MSETIRFGRETISYRLVHSPRRRTLGIEVRPDFSVIVRAPARCPPDLVRARVRRRAAWISRQLERFRRHPGARPPRQFLSGETHEYLGRAYRLKVLKGSETRVHISGDRLIVHLRNSRSSAEAETALLRWYRSQAAVQFRRVMETSSRRIHLRPEEHPRMIIRLMNRRWGSMSRTGSLSLNLSLIQAPRPCIEYVVLHEICHLRHADHGRAFRHLLTKAMPDWEARKARLNERAMISFDSRSQNFVR